MLKNPLYTQVKVFEGRVIYSGFIDQYSNGGQQKRLQKQRFERVGHAGEIWLLPDCVPGRATPRSSASGSSAADSRNDVDLIKTDGKKSGSPQVNPLRQEKTGKCRLPFRDRHINRGGHDRAPGQCRGRPVRRYYGAARKGARTRNDEDPEPGNPGGYFAEFTALRRKNEPFWGK